MSGRHSLFAGKAFAPLVLPAVYDDVLSYEEWLSKVIYRINELQEYIDDTMERIDEIVDQKVANRVAPIQEEVNQVKGQIITINKALKQLDVDIKKSLTNAKAYTDSEIKKVNKKYDPIIDNINKMIAKYKKDLEDALQRVYTSLSNDMKERDLFTLKEAKRYCHYVIGVNNNKIFAEIKELSDRIDNIINEYPELYDPATGKNEHMQELIYNMYRALRTFGIPSMLYDDQLITAEEYDGMALDAQTYDTAFVWRIWHKFKCMFNPITGKQESIADILNFLITQLRWNGKTVGEYDGLDVTAGEFDQSTYGAWAQDNSKYYTEPLINTKDKGYRNWVLIAQDNDGIDFVEFNKESISDICVNFGEDGLFTFPCGAGTYTAPNGCSIVVTEGNTVTIEFSIEPIIVYGVTYVTDITELDK